MIRGCASAVPRNLQLGLVDLASMGSVMPGHHRIRHPSVITASVIRPSISTPSSVRHHPYISSGLLSDDQLCYKT